MIGSRHRSRRNLIGMLLIVGVALLGCSNDEGAPEEADPATGTAPTEPGADETDQETDPASKQFAVFFTNLELGGEDEVHPVNRTTMGSDVVTVAFTELVAGPTADERDEGYSSWFSQETAGVVESVTIGDGVAQVSFDAALPSLIPNASTSAGSLMLLASLDATAEQFPTVDRAVYSLEGDVPAFYEWLQLSPPE